MQFNSRLQPTQIGLGASASNQSLLKLDYEYGELNLGTGQPIAGTNNGNIAKQTITVQNTAQAQGFTATQYYSYDSLNRIKIASENLTPNGGTLYNSWKQTFTFDRYGNRRFDTSGNNTTTLPANCQIAVCNPQIDPTTNKLIGTQFDDAGNTKTDANGQTFTYDAENKQVKVQNGVNVIGEYFYDGDGKRVKKIEYDQYGAEKEIIIFVYDGAGKLVAEYSTAAPVSNPTVNYTATDPLGSPRVITNKQGQIISRRGFKPFGEQLPTDATYRTAALKYNADDKIRQKFTGYQRDEETQLDFAEARYYNHKHGRFTAVDPLLASGKSANPQTFNRYAYTMNRPLVLTDPTGMQSGTKPNENKTSSPINVTVTIPTPGVIINMPREQKDGTTRYFSGVGSVATIKITDADGKPIVGATVSENVKRVAGSGRIKQNEGSVTTDSNGEIKDLTAIGDTTKKKVKDVEEKKSELIEESNETPTNDMVLQTLTIKTPDGGEYEATSVRIRTNIGEDGKPVKEVNSNGVNLTITQTNPIVKVVKPPNPAETPKPTERP